MKLKFFTLCITLMLCLIAMPSFALGAEGPAPIKLFMNNKLLKPEVAPQIIKGNTLVPVRIIAEELGALVSWNDKARKVNVKKDGLNIELTIDNRNVLVQGKKTELEVAPIIVNDNTLLPLRFIGEQLGAKFSWDGLTSSVHMFKPDEPDTNKPDPIPSKTPVPTPTPTIKPTTTPSPTVKPTTTPSPTGKPTPVPPNPTPSPSNPGTGNGNGTDGAVTVPKGVSLVQSIVMTQTDLVVKTNDGEIKPTVFKLANPSRIVFDLPNMTLDESLKKLLVGTTGEVKSTHPLVEKIRFSNYSTDPYTVRIILDLKESADYKIIPSKELNVMTATIKTPSLKVVIDAGHGAKDPGAISITGKQEKEFTLSLANKLNKLLSLDKRIDVLMTRSDDTFLELDERVAFANNQGADLFLSIHGNKFEPKPSVNGVETYYSRDDSISFAKIIHKHTLQSTGFEDRNVRQSDFRVIAKTTMPAVLLEVGYLSNKSNEAAMYQEQFQDRLAASLAAAIKEYLDIK
ncbi:N-acetylmuramoyl-L-alanine amidase AmiC precursor [compost metagenome]